MVGLVKRASPMTGLLVAAAVLLGAMAAPATAQGTVGARDQLEQQLQQQLATNEALRARIAKLEAILKTDVCADPSAAEALLREARPASP